MARGTNFKESNYTTDLLSIPTTPGSAKLVAKIRMDTNHLVEDVSGVPDVGNPQLPFHVSVHKNKNEYGLHPRYLELVAQPSNTADSNCLVNSSTTRRTLVVVNSAEFDTYEVWDGVAAPVTTGANKNAVNLPISTNGTTKQIFFVAKKVSERYV